MGCTELMPRRLCNVNTQHGGVITQDNVLMDNNASLDGLSETSLGSNQIKSNQIKSNQIKSNQIKSNQIKSNEDAVRYFSQPEYLSVIFIEKVRLYVATVSGHRLHFP
jgi:hypothetical protein